MPIRDALTAAVTAALLGLLLAPTAIRAQTAWIDDQSPFIQIGAPERETLLYIWTRDATGDAEDFIAVVDVDPASVSYGSIIGTSPTGSTGNEAHHFGYTADRTRIMAGGMFSNTLFLYDVAADPRAPRLLRTLDLSGTGYVGPHTPIAIDGGVLLAMMGAADGGSGAILALDNDGRVRGAYQAPENNGRPIHLYDVAVNPEANRMLASSFAHAEHFMHGVPDPEHVGSEVVVWDWQTGEVVQVEELDPSTVVLRWLRTPGANGGFVPSAFGNSVWHWHDPDGTGRYTFERVLELPDGSLPVDLRISHDDRTMFVSLWGAGEVRQYDIRDPRNPRLVHTVQLPQPNMMRLSHDSRRLYVTNSILSTLDGDVEFGAWLFHVGPEGMTRDNRFAPDFQGFSGGRAGPHDMLFR
jgi:methanethiol oxidase